MSLDNLQPCVKLIITNKNDGSTAAFGPGVAALCKGVERTGSLNAAAKSMHMAYSKAWKIIKETEKELGFQLLVRHGAQGSILSEEGKHLLSLFDQLSQHLNKEANDRFDELLGK